jgi:protein NrfD
MTELDILRHNGLLDPQMHIWGWQIPVYLFLGGMAAGVMIISALMTRRIALDRQSRAMRLLPFLAPLLLSFGMLALLFDLEFKLHVFRFYTALRITSPMSWGAWILVLIYPATLALGAARLTIGEIDLLNPRWPRLARIVAAGCSWTRRNVTALERLNIVLGIALGAYTGILLATLAARALWSSMWLAPLFLVSGFSAGAAVAMLLPTTSDERELLRRWDVAAMAAEAGVLAFFFIDLVADGGARGRAAAALLFGGPYTAVFWAIVVVAGLGVPMALETIESKRHLHPAVLAPVLLLIGGLALRWIFVLAGQAAI